MKQCTQRQRSARQGWLLILPLLLGCLVFYGAPFFQVLLRTFQNGISKHFVGWSNYQYMLQSSAFRLAFGNTMKFLLVSIPLMLVLAFAVALLLRTQAPLSAEEIAARLGQSQGDVRDALAYWEQTGLLRPQGVPALEGQPVFASISPPSPQIPVPAEPSQESGTLKERQKVIRVGAKQKLDRREVLSIIKRDERLSGLVDEAQQIMGKPLTSAEMETIASLYSYYGLAADFILMVIQYCCSIGRANMRYVEKTAASWVDLGIDTHEKAEQHILKLTDLHSKENQVRSAFGIGERSLIPKEEKFINTWFNDYGFDIAMIRLAYERTVEKIGKLSFPYIDSILSSWYKKGIKTPRQASEESRPQQPAADSPKHAPSRSTSYDLDQIEKMIYSDYLSK